MLVESILGVNILRGRSLYGFVLFLFFFLFYFVCIMISMTAEHREAGVGDIRWMSCYRTRFPVGKEKLELKKKKKKVYFFVFCPLLI